MTESFLVGGGGGSNCRYTQLHMNTLRSPTIKFRVEIECEVGGACHGVSCVQGKIVGPVGLGVYIHRSMVVCHLSECITLLLAQWSALVLTSIHLTTPLTIPIATASSDRHTVARFEPLLLF